MLFASPGHFASQASQTIHVHALSLVFHAANSERHGGVLRAGDQKDRVKTMLRAAKRVDDLAAASTALVAAVQACTAGKMSPLAVTKVAKALDAALVTPALVSDAELEATFAAGIQKADEIQQAEIDAWSRARRERSGEVEPSGLTLVMGKAPTAGAHGGDTADAAAGVSALLAGDVAGALRGASVLFPEGSSVRHGLRGASAVMKGDYRTALAEATKMVPADSSVGKALAMANSAVKLAS